MRGSVVWRRSDGAAAAARGACARRLREPGRTGSAYGRGGAARGGAGTALPGGGAGRGGEGWSGRASRSGLRDRGGVALPCEGPVAGAARWTPAAWGRRSRVGGRRGAAVRGSRAVRGRLGRAGSVGTGSWRRALRRPARDRPQRRHSGPTGSARSRRSQAVLLGSPPSMRAISASRATAVRSPAGRHHRVGLGQELAQRPGRHAHHAGQRGRPQGQRDVLAGPGHLHVPGRPRRADAGAAGGPPAGPSTDRSASRSTTQRPRSSDGCGGRAPTTSTTASGSPADQDSRSTGTWPRHGRPSPRTMLAADGLGHRAVPVPDRGSVAAGWVRPGPAGVGRMSEAWHRGPAIATRHRRGRPGSRPRAYPRRRARPVHVPPRGRARSPTQPGVYRFRDERGRVIYVGKAKSLRQRLNSYFADVAGLHPRTRQMVTSAAVVEWTVVAHRGRGAAAGVLLDQGVRPAVQRPLPGRQVLPEPGRDAVRGVPAAAGDARGEAEGRPLLRAVRARLGHPGDARPAAAGLPGPHLLRRGVQAGRPDRPALPARLHRQVLGAVRRPGRRRGAPGASSTTSSTSWPARPT